MIRLASVRLPAEMEDTRGIDHTEGDSMITAEPPRIFVMPVLGLEQGVKRSFVMGSIPISMQAGQAGAAAADALNPEAGKAL